MLFFILDCSSFFIPTHACALPTTLAIISLNSLNVLIVAVKALFQRFTSVYAFMVFSRPERGGFLCASPIAVLEVDLFIVSL